MILETYQEQQAIVQPDPPGQSFATVGTVYEDGIALIFNAGVFIYQAYTIFGKKRNPFKQELYIDNPRFRRVYLESIDVPEGQREAALANLEELGYAAAWDEKGRVKTMVERP